MVTRLRYVENDAEISQVATRQLCLRLVGASRRMELGRSSGHLLGRHIYRAGFGARQNRAQLPIRGSKNVPKAKDKKAKPKEQPQER